MSTRTEATEGQAKIRKYVDALLRSFSNYESGVGIKVDELRERVNAIKSILDASPPIVGELTEKEIERIALDVCARPAGDGDVTWEPDEVSQCMAALRKAREQGYIAQAPQSSPAPGVKPDGIMNEGYIEATRAHGSPAPSVIEAGDAMENMMRRLRTQRDDEGILPTGNDFNGMDGLCAAWVAAKASRPSVTAPDQGVTVDDDWIDEVAHRWAVSQWTEREDMQDQRMTEFGHAVRILRFALLTNPK